MSATTPVLKHTGMAAGCEGRTVTLLAAVVVHV